MNPEWDKTFENAFRSAQLPDSYYEGVLNNPIVKQARETKKKERKDKKNMSMLGAATVLAASDPFLKFLDKASDSIGLSGLFGGGQGAPDALSDLTKLGASGGVEEAAPSLLGDLSFGGGGFGGGAGGGEAVATGTGAEGLSLFGASPLLAAAAIVAGAITGAKQASGAKKALSGDNINFGEQAALALPTFGASFLANPINAITGSGKDKDQIQRDQARKILMDKGLMDEAYNITLADGSTYDIGKDGKSAPFNVDFKRPLAGSAAAAGGLLATSIFGSENKKIKDDMGGYFANAFMSNAQDELAVLQNAASFMKQAGLSDSRMRDLLGERLRRGLIDQATHDAQLNTLDAIAQAGSALDKNVRGQFIQVGQAANPPPTTGPVPYDQATSLKAPLFNATPQAVLGIK